MLPALRFRGPACAAGRPRRCPRPGGNRPGTLPCALACGPAGIPARSSDPVLPGPHPGARPTASWARRSSRRPAPCTRRGSMPTASLAAGQTTRRPPAGLHPAGATRLWPSRMFKADQFSSSSLRLRADSVTTRAAPAATEGREAGAKAAVAGTGSNRVCTARSAPSTSTPRFQPAPAAVTQASRSVRRRPRGCGLAAPLRKHVSRIESVSEVAGAHRGARRAARRRAVVVEHLPHVAQRAACEALARRLRPGCPRSAGLRATGPCLPPGSPRMAVDIRRVRGRMRMARCGRYSKNSLPGRCGR